MYDLYKQQTQELLPQAEYSKMVSPGTQKREIDLLKETLHFERFFFVLNLHDLKLDNVNGVQRWLGYPDKDFTLMKFLQIIHPSHAEAHYFTSTELIKGLMRGDWKIEFMKHRYITNIALRHSQGHYLLFKRLASAFQYDENHKLLEYVNEFTYVGDYKEEPYSIRAANEDGSKLVWLEEVLKRVQNAFAADKYAFTFQQLRILRKYAYQPDIQTSDIARAFKTEESTINTHKKRIQQKAQALFHKKFGHIKDIAAYLREQGLI